MSELIKRKVLISMLFIGLSLMGYFSYRHLAMELYPDAELPTLSVSISAKTEFDPVFIRNQAVIPVEGVISSLDGVEEISTNISTRNAQISISFNKSVNTKYAYLRLEEKLKSISKNIPEDFTVNLVKSGDKRASDQFMSLQILGEDDIDYVRNITDKDIISALENVSGIASATAIGGREKSVEILLDEQKCEALKLTSSKISSLIQDNMAEKSFIGSVYENRKQFFVNVVAEYLKIDDLGNIVVAEGPILLKDVAKITFGTKDEESFSRVNGKEVITCILSKTPNTNIIELSERVREEIDKLNRDLEAKGVNILIDTDSAEVMNSNINTIMNLGFTGAILAIFVLYIFLKNLKIISFIALAIPISVFSAFFFFYLFGITINTLTLTGIALAIGMLLDNSIVVMENIFRLRSMGYKAEEATIKGTKEVWKAITASTITTIVVFLPFLFSDDYLLTLIGEHVGVSIISTLLISLVVALLLIPMAINTLMKKNNENVNFNKVSLHNRTVQIYTALLKMSIRRAGLVVMSSILVLVILAILSMTLTMNTLKEVEVDTFNVYMTFNSSNTLDKTNEVCRLYEERLEEIEEIEQFSSKIYQTDANFTIKLKEDYEEINHKNIAYLKTQVLALSSNLAISDISLDAMESSENFQGGGSSFGGADALLKRMGMGQQREQIIIKGQDFEKMMNYAELLKYQIEELDNISNANVSASQGKSEAKIIFDQYLMGINSVSPQNVANELRALNPQTSNSFTYKTNDEEYDIIVKNEEKEKTEFEEEFSNDNKTLDDLREVRITNSENAIVELQRVSKIQLGRGKGNIKRLNQDEIININYRFSSDVNESKDLLEEARMEIDELVESSDIPTGIAVEVKHEENETDEYVFLILATLAIIFMILASVFESLTAPIVLMFAIPLAAIGSLTALLCTSNSLINANVFIGFIILVGIVVNNSIILIDYTKQLRERGCRKNKALIIAGLSRLRPILITALTTIIAMFPLALGKGEFVSGLGAPFAITVIGGLTMSTILTLIIVPTLYSGLEEALKRLRTQSIEMKLIQFILMLAAIGSIIIINDTLIWNLLYLIAAIILIPGITWFVESSLRHANSNIIAKNEEIEIEIRNLVKIYGKENEFLNELHSGLRIRKRLGILNEYKTLQDLRSLIWFVPITIFLFYFTYVYQTMILWCFIFSVVTYFACCHLINVLDNYCQNNNMGKTLKFIRLLRKAVIYFMPLFTIIIMNSEFLNAGVANLLGIVWYIFIAAKYLSDRINKDNININNIEGRFADIRKTIYTIASNMPFVGVKKKPFKALNAVSMKIHTGMFGLLGPNGAGKTTLMRIICGIYEQSYGKIFINGIDTQQKREELQGLIGYLPQEFGTYENLTSWEFLDYQAILKGIYDKDTRQKRITEVLQAVHMYENKDKKIGGFSGGMKQRIGIAQTLLNLPRILVVDEPTAGLDPRERIRFRNLLVELSKNRIVIFSTHIIEDIASSCNQVGIINKGSLKYHGSPNDMVNIAKDVTWTFDIPVNEFADISKDIVIVHHIRDGENIRVRCLSESKPRANAVKTEPLLEDSYLWLLRSVKIANHEELITGNGLK